MLECRKEIISPV